MEILKQNSFVQNIAAAQRELLHEWLAGHTYEEVQQMIAQPPPEGFGLEVSISTLSRYYKKNFTSIYQIRHEKLFVQAAESLRLESNDEGTYRETLSRAQRSIFRKNSSKCSINRLNPFPTSNASPASPKPFRTWKLNGPDERHQGQSPQRDDWPSY